MKTATVLLPCLATLCFLEIGCRQDSQNGPSLRQDLRLATTTSVENTGLLATLLKPYQQRTGIQVNVLAVGSGQALALARRGDVDAVLVHAPQAEKAFMTAGHGSDHRTLMSNDFVIVGPKEDPASIRGEKDAAVAMQKIAGSQSVFVSRGDQSGTHLAEKNLWQAANQQPKPPWYLESGQGQRLSLGVANEKAAYTLVDRATFVLAQEQMALEILVESDPRLYNPYSVIAVHPERHTQANYLAAIALVAWLSSTECQDLISAFRHNGLVLFHPNSTTR